MKGFCLFGFFFLFNRGLANFPWGLLDEVVNLSFTRISMYCSGTCTAIFEWRQARSSEATVARFPARIIVI